MSVENKHNQMNKADEKLMYRINKSGMRAFDAEQVGKLAIKYASTGKYIFIQEVASCFPMVLATFYELIGAGSKTMEEIKTHINRAKISQKQEIRDRWLKGDNGVTQIALYRLLSTPEEHNLLNNKLEETNAPKATQKVEIEIITKDGSPKEEG